MKKLFLIALLSTAACGGSQVQSGAAYRTAVHVARVFCAAVAQLPDPAPATDSTDETSGGSTP
jgi:hypothetical protein